VWNEIICNVGIFQLVNQEQPGTRPTTIAYLRVIEIFTEMA
jgi:hypothetical protein